MKMSKLDDLVNMAILAQGFGFIPIGMKDKVPVGRGWQNLTYNKEDALKNIRRIVHIYNANNDYMNNIGVLTGVKSNLIVIDVDEGGIEWWNELVRENEIPVTFTVQTGTGYHLYFKYEPGFKNMNKILGHDVDLRTDGGAIVFPGSTVNGVTYKVLYGYDNNVPVFSKMPDWLVKLLRTNIK